MRVEGVGKSSVQGDVRFAEALEKMGAIISMGDNWIEASAPANNKLKAIDLDCNHIPDAAMTLAGFKGGIPRRPLLPLTAGQTAALKKTLIEEGLLEQTT